MDLSRCFLGLACLAVAASWNTCSPLGADDGVATSHRPVSISLDDNRSAKITDGPSEITDGPSEIGDSSVGINPVTDVQKCTSRSTGSACTCSTCSCEPDAPWSLPQPCLLQQTGIKMGGWLQQGITMNPYHSNDAFNGPVATNDFEDEYQMNQLWLYFDRPADTGGCGTAIGGHIDMIYGTDWRFGINNGLETRINGFDDQRYGLVIPQMYVEFAVNNLSVKLGHFAAILDYEAVPAVKNPFYSHSYSYGYTVPQLVTGLLSEYKLTEQLAVQAGFHRGWSMFEDNNGTLDFMGGVKWASEDKATQIAYAVSVGPQDPEVNAIPPDQNRFVYSLVIQQRITEQLQYVAVQNLGTELNASLDGSTGRWYGLNQYFLYTINPCWSANLRAEWLRDADGVRVAGPGNIPGVYAWAGHGYAGDFGAITAGLNWRPNGNWIVRPECRWDWFDGPAGPVGLPFDGGAEDKQFTFAVDAVLMF